MAFITPKTDWAPTDFINYSDYNRIVNNLYELKDLALAVLNVRAGFITMRTIDSFLAIPTNKMYNNIEYNLSVLNSVTYKFNIGKSVVFQTNSKYIDYTELNRIESAILKIYKTLIAQESIKPHLAIQLGGGKEFLVARN
jgi:hypothetical protein